MQGRMFLLVILFLCPHAIYAQNPLGNCEGGRGVPYTLSSTGGSCNFPAGSIVLAPANVNQAYYNNGAQCGVCYEVTGPWGTQVVQVVDQCDSSAPRCGGDEVNFGIDNTAFGLIANRTAVDVITDLGFREVTCAVTGNVQMQAVSYSSSNSFFFSLVFWNYRLPFTEVRVQGKGWSTYDLATRQGSTAVWSWNKNKNSLAFPVTISLVGSTGQLISTSVNSLTQGATVDFGTQFADVNGGTGICPMGSSPAVVYTDSVATGWDTTFSFRTTVLNPSDTSNPFSGSDCLNVGLNVQGGLQFTRDGGFNPQYFSDLTFAARSDNIANLRIYMGDGTNGLSAAIQTTSTWQVYNISVTHLSTSNLETALVFFNQDDTNAQNLFFDQIAWVINPVSPAANVTQVPAGGPQINSTATVAPIVIVGGSDSTGSTPSPTSGASLTQNNFAFLFALALLALRFW